MSEQLNPNTLVLPEVSASRAENLDERGIPRNLGPQFRAMQGAGYDEANHTVSMALSSDQPVERWYGIEILSHEPGAIRTGRLKQGIPLLFNHDMGLHIGVSTDFKIKDGTLRTTSRFGENPLALEKELDVRSGILKDNSVGYMVYEWEITEDKNGVRTMKAVDWEPFEGSLVTVPADAKGSGVGRNSGEGEVPVKYTFRKLEADEPAGDEADEDDDPDEDEAERSLDAGTPAPPISAPDSTTSEQQRTTTMVAEAGVDHVAQNAERVTALRALHTQYPNEFNERALNGAIALDVSVETAKSRIADAVIAAAQRTEVPTLGDEVLGDMSEREYKSYFLRDAYAAAVNVRNPGTFSDKGATGFATEVSDTIRTKASERGIQVGPGVLIPSYGSRSRQQMQRTIAAGGNFGTYTNFTEVLSDPIELLRARVAIFALGAQMLTGLKGKLQWPRQNAAASSNWVAEASAGSNSDLGMDDIVMQPNRLTMINSYYRDALAQSAVSIEPLLAADRFAVLQRALDTAGIAGSGTAPVPKGLLNQSGLAAVLAGTTRAGNGTVTAGAGGVPMTYVDYNNMEATISTSNGDIGTLRWLTTPKVRASGRSTPKTPGTATDYVWPDSGNGAGTGLQTGPLGYAALCTSASYLTGFSANSVNNLHATILGVWDQLLVGDWGLSEVIVDNITGAASAKVIITEHGFYDINVRHIEAFCACTSALPS